MVAWPAHWNVSGVMTFLVNQDGVVLEKDLGPQTVTIAEKMQEYDPDESWQRAKD